MGNINENNRRWEKTYLAVIGALFVLIVGMITYLANQYDKRMTVTETKIELIQQQININKEDLQKQLNEMNIHLIRMESKIDLLTVRSNK